MEAEEFLLGFFLKNDDAQILIEMFSPLHCLHSFKLKDKTHKKWSKQSYLRFYGFIILGEVTLYPGTQTDGGPM